MAIALGSGRMGAAGNIPTTDKTAEYSSSAEYSGSGEYFNPGSAPPVWADSGFFMGLGLAWTWGGYFQGSSSVFRGGVALVMAGYKWAKYRVGLEIRPAWDRALGVVRLPITLSLGNDFFQLFGGPAYTFGEPSLGLKDGERSYSGGRAWRWELGFSGAFPNIRLSRGMLSFYGELAWQPYRLESGEKFKSNPDVAANLRLSTGIRYLWRL